MGLLCIHAVLSLCSDRLSCFRAYGTALKSHQTEGEGGKSRGHPVLLLTPRQDELYLRHSWQILSKLFLKASSDGYFTPFLTVYSGTSLSLSVFSLVSHINLPCRNLNSGLLVLTSKGTAIRSSSSSYKQIPILLPLSSLDNPSPFPSLFPCCPHLLGFCSSPPSSSGFSSAVLQDMHMESFVEWISGDKLTTADCASAG